MVILEHDRSPTKLPHVTDPNMKSKPPTESARKPSLKGRPFYHRFLLALGLALILIAISLVLGILGYHFIAKFDWVDSIMNASMILASMGPVGTLNSDGAKLFASAYALFSGLVFITASGILLAPIFHRVLHKFHLEEHDLK